MQFANSIWLWGLTGMIIPVAIHLLSRKQGKVIKFGSIRHLDETSTRQFKAIRLNEVVLLLLRCLFIVFLVLGLAGLQVGSEKNKWLIIENGLENHPDYTVLIDSLKSKGFKVKSMSSDVATDNDTITSEKIDYWNLLQRLQPGDGVVVLSYNYADGFKGKRVSLPDGVRWLSADPDSIEFVLETIEKSGDSLIIRRGNSRADKTYFQNFVKAKKDLSPVQLQQMDTIAVAVVFDSFYEYDKNIFLAALRAVKNKGLIPLQTESTPVERYENNRRHDWIVWLSDRSPPALSGNLILMNKDETSSPDLFHQTNGSGNTWLLTMRLNEEVALRENLAVRLTLMLHPKNKLEARVRQLDKRVLPEKLMWSSLQKNPDRFNSETRNEGDLKYVWITTLLILVAERLLAFNRDQ